ncbi:glycosyltransferase [Vulcanisaeta distributa]|uniref:Glycosyl transferase group 1 n=1 Tax=Vulcanisaeta distributa (strain DSM 14429 / JCM 11212 / NBRC 100878 / IC-017) TaxID=572478 RepID=E1QUD8_VULDI|nr:glycosyltransferase [Vulcanisaeta distributa]ADN49864.1 glycosyl transferase group 1 [Vulcanisaeta distributa DSM 14429]
MLKVVLLTNTINRAGGAEQVTLAMYKALTSLSNVKVLVLGREELRPELLKLWVPGNLLKDFVSHYIYVRRFDHELHKLLNYDLIVNTRSNEILAPAHVHYFHWVFSPYGVKDTEALAYYKLAYNIKDGIVRHAIRHVLHYILAKFSKVTLANSKYTANLLKDLGIKAHVLYPPVKASEIATRAESLIRDKKPIVITISRIDNGKSLEILPMVAFKIKSMRFILVGSLANYDYYMKLVKLSKALGLDNFIIMPNLPKDKLYDLLAISSIYLHTAHHEQFGISIVEGMAAGCIPVVHRSGGPYEDILDKSDGIYGFSYGDIDELISIINNISIMNKGELADLRKNALRRALSFDEGVFIAKFRSIISSLIS